MAAAANDPTVRVTEHVRFEPRSNEIALRVYERSAVVCCESQMGRPEVADLVRALVSWLAIPDAAGQVVEAHVWPENWPPKHGDIWEASNGRRWVCEDQGKVLSRLSRSTDPWDLDDDAPPDVVEKTRGPMKLVYRPTPWNQECPF